MSTLINNVAASAANGVANGVASTITSAADPLAALTGSGAATAAKKAAAGSAADTESRFLSLLVAQLKNQDPLNPMDNAEITTQLAQISTTNGVERLNATLTAMSGDFDGLQTLQAASLAGRQVMVAGDRLALANGVAHAGYNLGGAVDTLSVSIVDARGAVVQKVDLGAQQAGLHAFQWDGLTDTGKPAADGNYTFKLDGRLLGQPVTAETLAIGLVQGVRPQVGGAQLSIAGHGDVALADVKKIF